MTDRSPLGAACRAQCRADRRGAARRPAGARAGARSGERERRACASFRARISEIALAAERSGAGGVALDRGVAGRGGAVQPAAAGLARRAGGGLAGAAGRRDPVHQHGPYQPLVGDRRAAARRGAAARRRARRSISTAPIGRQASRPRRATRRSTPICARAIRNGGCASWRRWSPRRRSAASRWTGHRDAGEQPVGGAFESPDAAAARTGRSSSRR